ncbi:hypothetical protein [Halolamina rubra]|uniref:hypothetical protein n=1 Tax=Halolamina rubra TaxID=1380430 RepID=UPI0012ABE3C8|nr:hypothetical protein [Halolamina rubra]
MDPEGAIEAVFATFVALVLVYVFSDIIFQTQGPLWGGLFIIACIVILIGSIVGEL